jgi:hypothetical protein
MKGLTICGTFSVLTLKFVYKILEMAAITNFSDLDLTKEYLYSDYLF